MKLIDKMVEYFTRLNKRMKRWQRAVSILSAIVVFVTTYALILPAITLDVDTASTQAGIEVASENEPDAAGTVYESAEEEADDGSSEEEEITESSDNGSAVTESSTQEDAAAATTSKAADTVASTAASTAESVIADTAAAASTEEAPALITEATQLTYQGKDYIVYADFDGSAQLPVGVELKAEEITKDSDPEAYEAYYKKTLEELKDKYDENTGLSFAKFYDIAFIYEGKEVEPKGNVAVRIEYEEAVKLEEETKVDAVHFDKEDDEKAKIIDSENKVTDDTEMESIEFESDKFSVYGVIGAETFTEKFLTEDGETYNISVTAGADAHIPANAKLEISEVKEGSDKYDELFEKAQAAVTDGKDASVPFARFFDIAIVKDGEKIQPDAPVDVKISFDETVEANKNAVFNAVHIADDGENVDVLDVETDGEESEEAVAVNAVQFSAEGFSIYGVTYTVDFEYTDPITGKTYYYSIDGESSINLTDLLVVLGIKSEDETAKFVAEEVTNVEFSDPELVKVTRKGKTLGLFGKADWLLESLKPFDTEETLTISLKDGGEIVVKVTDENTSSANLNDFIKSATIVADKEGGVYVLKPGKIYTASITFEEDPDGFQFDDSGELTYTLPDGFTPDGLNSGTFTIKATQYDEEIGREVEYPVEGNRYEVVGNQLKVYLNTDSPNYHYVTSSANADLNLKITGIFNQNKTNIDWGGGVNTEIKFDTDAGVSVQKSITNFDAATGTVTYSVSIKALNGRSTDIVVTDQINGNHVSIDHNVNLSGANMSSEGISYNVVDWNQNTTGFRFTIPSMESGQEATVTYTAKLKDGYDTWEGGNTFSAKPGGDNKPDSDSQDLSHYIQKPSISKTSDVSGVVNGRQTITWTIVATSDDYMTLAGETIKDTIKADSRADMHYSGNGLTIVVTDANGQSETRYPSWESVGVTNKNLDYSWTYNVPPTDTGDRTYVITYTTEVNVSNMASDAVMKNGVDDKYGHSDGTGTVGPEGDDHKATIDKIVKEVTADKITWNVELEVPVQGLTIAKLTDYLPANTDRGFYDVLDGSVDDISIVGINQENERVIRTYNAPDSANRKPGEVILNFQKKDGYGNWIDGLNGGTALRKIIVTITSKNDKSWMEAAEIDNYLREHTNTAKFQANNYEIDDSDKGTPMNSSLKKSLNNTGTVDGLPVYYYKIEVTGVTGPFTIKDSFDDRLELYGNPTIKGGDQYYQGETTSKPNPAVDTSTDGNIEFSISNDNLARNGEGYYSHYLIEYALKVKDADALASIKADAAADSEGIKKLTNTATSTLGEDSVDVEYKYTGLTKELVNEAEIGVTTNICKFKLTVNPEGLDMNPEGDTITLKDVFSKTLSIDYHSISVEPQEGASWNVSGYEASFVLPDETPIVITYDARIVGEGLIPFKNTATIGGQKAEYSDEKNVTADMGGSASNYNVKILKHKRNELSTPLAGAVFELYYGDGTPVKKNNNEIVKVTTLSNGTAYVGGNQSTDGWALRKGVEYYLWEITAPEGYILRDEATRTKYRFTIASDDIADYDNNIYHNGDTLHIANTPLGGIEIRKSFRGNSISDDEKAKITFTVTGPDGYNKTVKLSEFPDGKSYKITGLPVGDYTVVESNADVDGYVRSTSHYVGTDSTVEGETATVTLSNATEEKVITYINKYRSEVDINPEDIQLRVQKKWYQGEEDKTSSGDYDDKSVDVQVERFRAVMPSTTLHLVHDNDDEFDTEIVPQNADVVIKVATPLNICVKQSKTGMWSQPYYPNNNQGPRHVDNLNFNVGTNEDLYVYFQGNPVGISIEYTGGSGSVPDEQFQPDSSYTGPTITLTNGTWSKNIYNLPTTGEEGTTKYIYKYLVKEISAISGFETTYQVDGGDFKETLSQADAIGESGDHNIVIKNTSESGSLKLTKEVTVNGVKPTEANKTLINGTYEFTVTSVSDSSDTHTVKITFTDGIATSYQIDNNEEVTFTNGANPWTVEVPNLAAGDYTIEETTPTNGTKLESAVRGDDDEEAVDENKAVTVTVRAGEVPKVNSIGAAYFTNNLETVVSRVKKVWLGDKSHVDSLIVTLKKDDQDTTITQTLNADNSWTAEVTNLAKYNEDGSVISYSWGEATISGYSSSGVDTEDITEEGGTTTYLTTLTNVPDENYNPKTSFTVTKAWEDNGDDKPTGITVNLYSGTSPNGVLVGTATISETNGWTHTFTELPVFDSEGNVINYYAEEVVPNGYSETSVTVAPTYERDPDSDSNVSVVTPNNSFSISTGTDLAYIVIKSGHTFTIWTPRKASTTELNEIADKVSNATGAVGNNDFSQLRISNGDGTYTYNYNNVFGVPYNELKNANTTASIYMDGDNVMINFGNKTWSSVAFGKLAYIYTTGNTEITNTSIVDIDAEKVWKNADQTLQNVQASVVFTLQNSLDGSTWQDVSSITLDGTTDDNGEASAWLARWKDLPKYEKVETPVGEGEQASTTTTYTLIQYRIEERNASITVNGETITLIAAPIIVVSNAGDYITPESNDDHINPYAEGTLENDINNETRFDFSKVWKVNGSEIDWPSDISEIKIKLKRTAKDKTDEETDWIAITKDMTTISITSPFTGTITNTTTAGSKEYTFSITGLEKDADRDATKPWTYSITEQQVSGYNKPRYFTIRTTNTETGDNSTQTETEHNYSTESISVSPGDTGGVKIVNDQITVTLPSTGGPGTKLFYGLGISFVGFAGLLLFIKRRELRDLSKRRW